MRIALKLMKDYHIFVDDHPYPIIDVNGWRCKRRERTHSGRVESVKRKIPGRWKINEQSRCPACKKQVTGILYTSHLKWATCKSF